MEFDSEEPDFLDEIVQEGIARDANFPRLLAAAERARALMRQLARSRASSGISQVEVAKRMKTSQPAVARLEAGESDPRLSTVERYAGVFGQRLTATVLASTAATFDLGAGQLIVWRLGNRENIVVHLGDAVAPAPYDAAQSQVRVSYPTDNVRAA